MTKHGAASGAGGLRRHGWWAGVAESFESRLWPIPVAAVIVAVVLGIFLPRLDLLVDETLPTAVDSAVFNGGADTARSVLSSIAGSLITATSLTFSLTVVALQLASSQASPRVLRLFARDRQVHWTLAAFLGTFAYSITVLRSVRSATEDVPEFVPRISVTVAFVLTLASVVMLVFFLAHLATQLRVETMLKDIHAETDRTIDRIGERNAAAKPYASAIRIPTTEQIVTASSSGFITGHDHEALVGLGIDQGIVVRELKRVGENVVSGTPLASWWHSDESEPPGDADLIADAIRDAYALGYERTAAEDIDYGVEQILDIGLRALSAGVNDPTTAVHALGHLSAITGRTLDMPRLPEGLAGPDGDLRVVTVARTPTDEIHAGLSPFRHYGAEHPALVFRFAAVAEELSYLASHPEVDAALTAELDALELQLRAMQQDPVATENLLRLVGEVRARVRARSEGGRAVPYPTTPGHT